jgi:hypothetical protein
MKFAAYISDEIKLSDDTHVQVTYGPSKLPLRVVIDIPASADSSVEKFLSDPENFERVAAALRESRARHNPQLGAVCPDHGYTHDDTDDGECLQCVKERVGDPSDS